MIELQAWLDNDPTQRWATVEYLSLSRWRVTVGSKRTKLVGEGNGPSVLFASVLAITEYARAEPEQS